MPAGPGRRRRRVLLPVAAAALAWPFVEPLLPVLRHVEVPVLDPGQQPLRLLHLSDLHLLDRHRHRAAWVRSLADVRPDLVVSTGDHLSSADAVGLLARTLGALTAGGTPGVFVPGNNDFYTPVRPRLGQLTGTPLHRPGPDLPWSRAAAALVDVGWTDLTQRRVVLPLGGREVVLTGTDDAHLQRDHYADVGGPTTGLALGVTHTPARRLLHAFDVDGHALVLAGHTHGGQLRLPLLGPATTNCDLERSRARGLSRTGRGWLHVSAGLGTSPYVPLRLCCRPEATVLTLVERGGRRVR